MFRCIQIDAALRAALVLDEVDLGLSWDWTQVKTTKRMAGRLARGMEQFGEFLSWHVFHCSLFSARRATSGSLDNGRGRLPAQPALAGCMVSGLFVSRCFVPEGLRCFIDCRWRSYSNAGQTSKLWCTSPVLTISGATLAM